MEVTKDYRKTIRLNSSLYKDLERLAIKQNRNFSNLVVTLLKEKVEEEQKSQLA